MFVGAQVALYWTGPQSSNIVGPRIGGDFWTIINDYQFEDALDAPTLIRFWLWFWLKIVPGLGRGGNFSILYIIF